MAQPDMALDPEVQKMLGLPPIKSVGLPPTSAQNADGKDPDPDESTEDGPPRATGGAGRRRRAITAALDRADRAGRAERAGPPSPEAVFNASPS